jgi:glycosyltransferase involved in cell wall biosynthesis
MTPLVSIIMPAHNAARCLPETIRSVREQSYPNWELMVADDASTDSTAAIVEDAARNDPRIHLVHIPPPNGSAARARNTAMAAAHGEFFAFLDADDLWLPEKLARQVDHLLKHPESAGVCTWHLVFGDEDVAAQKRAMQRFPRSKTVERQEMLFACPFQTSTLVFRKECYENLGGMDEDPRLRVGEDYEYFVRLLNAYRIDRIPEVLVRYRVAPAHSLTQQHVAGISAYGWQVFDVLQEKNLLHPEELRVKEAALHYEEAKNNLFHLHAPFRRSLWRSVATLHAPKEAIGMAALSFLPAPVLRRVLLGVRGAINRLRVGH